MLLETALFFVFDPVPELRLRAIFRVAVYPLSCYCLESNGSMTFFSFVVNALESKVVGLYLK